MVEIAVSSFSMRTQMGSVSFRSPDADGVEKSLTLDYPELIDIADFVERARGAWGVDLVEICQVQLDDPSPAVLEKIAAALTGSAVGLLTMPIDVGDIAHPLPEVRERSILGNIAWFDIAAEWDARYVRVNAISGLEARGQAAPRADSVAGLRRLADAAEERGLGLLLENKGGLRHYPELMLELVAAVGADRVGIILDTGNVEPLVTAMNSRLLGIESGIVDLQLERVYQVIELLAPHATVVHAKSHDIDESGSAGPVDLPRALGIVRAAGFTGPVSIEYEGIDGDPWSNTARTVDIVRGAFA